MTAKNATIIKEIRVGVTGHRVLPNLNRLRKTVNSILKQIKGQISKNNTERIQLIAVSPLAEGADRLVADEILNHDGQLEVVLPFKITEYVTDFQSIASKNEFYKLLEHASSITVTKKVDSRKVAYEESGKFVVDNSNILIALWDGNPPMGRGGTSDIVKYARVIQKTIYWINTQEPEKVIKWNG